MKKIKLVAEERNEIGTCACKRLRKSGMIPAVVYGSNGEENLKISTPEFRKFVREAGASACIIELLYNNKAKMAMIKATQRNSLSDSYDHIDFKEVLADEPITTALPIHLVGESAGVKLGGILEVMHHTVSVECLAENLPEFIEIDISELNVGESIHVRSLPSVKGVKYLQQRDAVVISCSSAEEDGDDKSAENAS